MNNKKIATISIDLKNSKNHREALCTWLHEKAEEIKIIDDKEYVKNPKWNFII